MTGCANLLKAQTVLHIAQEHEQSAYNQGRLAREFEEGDQVLINPHSMSLTKDLEGKRKKLIAQYEGPFKIIRKLSPITYQLRIPLSYKIHPVISVAHLEAYKVLPAEFGKRVQRPSMRQAFKELPEMEVERISAKQVGAIGRLWRKEYLVHFKNGVPGQEEWLSEKQLANAPVVVRTWKTENVP